MRMHTQLERSFSWGLLFQLQHHKDAIEAYREEYVLFSAAHHIQRCASHMTRLDRVQKGSFIDDATSSAVDNANAFLAFHQGVRVQQVLGVLRQGRVNGDEIRLTRKIRKDQEARSYMTHLRVQFIQRYGFNPKISCRLFRKNRVVT